MDEDITETNNHILVNEHDKHDEHDEHDDVTIPSELENDMNMPPSVTGVPRKKLTGWLLKKGGVMKTWHRRWFVLSDKMLFQFSRQDDVKCQNSYFLSNGSYRVMENTISPDEPDKYCFDLTPGPKTETGTGETVVLSASSAEERLMWVKALRYALFAEKGGAIFGLPIEEAMVFMKLKGRKIPIIIEQCVDYLYIHGIEVEGILRLAGRTSVIRRLKEQFDCGEPVSFENADVNSVASLLKLYLRELPESIIPCKVYQRYMNHALRFMDAKDDVKKEACVAELAANMPELPKDNYTILKYLCKFLHDIAAKSAINKMNTSNIARVFGPNIIRHMDDNPELLMVTVDLTEQLTVMMIEYFDTVFSFDYRDDGNLNVPEADLLRMSKMDANPVLRPQIVLPPAVSVLDEPSRLNLKFADEFTDKPSQSSNQLSPESPLDFLDNNYEAKAIENEKQASTTQKEGTAAAANKPVPRERPIPPKRRSKIARGRRISERRSGGHSENESDGVTLSQSIEEALVKKGLEKACTLPHNGSKYHVDSNGTLSCVGADMPGRIRKSASVRHYPPTRTSAADGKVELTTEQLQIQNEALKLELVNIKTKYDDTIKLLQKEQKVLVGKYEKNIESMEVMIRSQNQCLQKEKQDRSEAVERIVQLQAQLHTYQMTYGEIK